MQYSAMFVCRLAIANYKSLRDVVLEPKDLTVLIGANASGKSNLAECIDFISEVYRHGLEVAVARKGGYENIAHRKASRSKASMTVDITVEFALDPYWMPHGLAALIRDKTIRLQHSFSFVARGSAISAEFQVERELLIVQMAGGGSKYVDLIQLVRDDQKITNKIIRDDEAMRAFDWIKEPDMLRYLIRFPDFDQDSTGMGELVSPTDLAVVQIGRFSPLHRQCVNEMAAIRVFQISHDRTRDFGVPTPRPELDRTGANLPAVVDLFQKKNPEVWQRILQTMRRVLPALERIEVNYTTSRTLGLFFHEKGFGRPWTVEEISDGTIQTLCLLVAIFDPTRTMLVLEELENSVHPWVIRNLLSACSEATAGGMKPQQILITTHSPVIIDHVTPDKVWVMWRTDGESHVKKLNELDPSITALWESGEVATFELIDSGTVSEAIPPKSAANADREQEKP
ncbi:MAG: AAA family ATPase [Verrucomicrobiota bacterium]